MTEPDENSECQPAGESAQDVVAEDGVDLTPVRWWLSMSTAERLATLQANANGLQDLGEIARFEE